MPKNFFNLPPPWNPGLAIPNSVMSEGLERHAFVTRMLPRGTYDNATNGNPAGYAIPQYVHAEGTGRGTYTTAWTPRGYYGPRIPQYLNRQPVANIVLGDVAEMPVGPIGGQPITSLPPPKKVIRALRRGAAMQALGATFSGLVQTTPSTTPYTPPPKPDTGREYTGGAAGDKRPNARAPAGGYGYGPGGVMVAPPPPPQPSIVSRILPLALLGGAAFVAYRIYTNRKAPGTP